MGSKCKFVYVREKLELRFGRGSGLPSEVSEMLAEVVTAKVPLRSKVVVESINLISVYINGLFSPLKAAFLIVNV